jgi:hypothetical protein
VVEDGAVQIAGGVVVHQVLVSGVAPGNHRPIDQDHVTNFQGANFFFAQWSLQPNFSA